MQFTFPTTTIATVFGSALLAASTSREVAASVSFPHKAVDSTFGSLGAHVKTEGDECSYENPLKLEETHLDIGILGCGPGLACAEDPTSSLGGRCGALALGFAEPAIEYAVDLSMPCTFTNGTDGHKCAGTEACSGSNHTRIGCGSCIGHHSCFNLTGYVKIGENSCLGDRSCALDERSFAYAYVVTIGDNSCVDPSSCFGLTGNVTIGENSCVGSFSCKYADGTENPVQIGSNSCHEWFGSVCKYVSGATIGNDSCVASSACRHFTGTVGNGSCGGGFSCYSFASQIYTGTIGDNSCNGSFSCVFFASRNTGDNSCNGYYACTSVTYNVGNDTCNEDFACPNCYPTAQQVKLQSITGDPIQVFEVQVLSSGVNVAEGKSAEQSSTFRGNLKFVANNAIDGNPNTFSHTVASRTCPPWWEVDLGAMFPVESIKILNRWCRDESDAPACLCRLSHASLALFDNAGRCVESISIGDVCGDIEVKHDFKRSREFCNWNIPMANVQRKLLV